MTLASALHAGSAGAVVGRTPDDVVTLEGPDARRFANGMFSNNVRDLAVGGWHRSVALDDRGRVVGQLDVLCTADDAFLLVVEGGAEAFIERYETFVLFDDVELASHPELAVWTVQGVSLPPVPAGWRATPRSRSPWGGIDLIGPADADLATDLGVEACPAAVVDALRVLAGQARWPRDIGPKRLPSQLDIRETHLSFDKGCYLGQESVNRIDVMGKVRKALALLAIDGAPPEDGTDVTVDGVGIGSCTSGTALPGGGSVALAVVRRPHDAVGSAVRCGPSPAVVVARPHLP